jgi:hypothetical protein
VNTDVQSRNLIRSPTTFSSYDDTPHTLDLELRVYQIRSNQIIPYYTLHDLQSFPLPPVRIYPSTNCPNLNQLAPSSLFHASAPPPHHLPTSSTAGPNCLHPFPGCGRSRSIHVVIVATFLVLWIRVRCRDALAPALALAPRPVLREGSGNPPRRGPRAWRAGFDAAALACYRQDWGCSSPDQGWGRGWKGCRRCRMNIRRGNAS